MSFIISFCTLSHFFFIDHSHTSSPSCHVPPTYLYTSCFFFVSLISLSFFSTFFFFLLFFSRFLFFFYKENYISTWHLLVLALDIYPTNDIKLLPNVALILPLWFAVINKIKYIK